MAPFRSLLAPFGRILVTFVEGLGDFLEAFPRQMEICTYVPEFFLSLFPFSALPVPLLRRACGIGGYLGIGGCRVGGWGI